MAPETHQILLIEDDPAHTEAVQRSLESGGQFARIRVAASLAEARRCIAESPPDAVIAELNLCDGKAYDLISDHPDTTFPLLVMTSHGDEQMAAQALKAGALDYVVKSPETFAQMPRLVERVLREWRNISERAQAQRALRESERRLMDIIDFLPDPTFAVDREGHLIAWNQAMERMTGRDKSQLLGQHIHTQYAAFYATPHPILLDAVLNPKVDFSTAYDYIKRDGDQVVAEVFSPMLNAGQGAHLWIVAAPLFNTDRELTGAIESIRDISDTKQAQIALQQAYSETRAITASVRDHEYLRLAATVLKNIREGLMISDAQANKVIAINQAFTDITGYTHAEALQGTTRLLRSGRQDPAFYQAMWASIKRSGHWQGEIWNRRKNGEIFPAWLTISTVRDEQGEITHYVAVLSDISTVKQSEAQLEQLAHYDPLTSLPNRLLLNSRLEHAIQHARRKNTKVAVLFIDLDRFKHVNDSLGHPVGDELLQAVAQRLSGRIRSEDTLARLGGDEFVVLLESIAKPDACGLVAQMIIGLMQPPFRLTGEREIFIGASVGISIYPDNGNNASDLLRNADTAMSQAKAQGRNTYRYYTESLTRAANARMTLESKLRHALDREEFVVYFQPQVSMSNERILGVEALVRWQDPEEGLIPPDQFIPLAEETRLIVPLGAWVLKESCRQMRIWRDAGLPSMMIAVNLSIQQFTQRDLAVQVADILEAFDLPSSCLELELTESMIMQNDVHSLDILDALHELGVGLAIDDFGTGYSSLAYLKRLPIDRLKIDKSFVDGIPADRNDAEIATTIIAMAHNLKLSVLAEGVETPEQHAFLQDAGCDSYQGYLFSRPVPAESIEARFRRT